MLNWFWFALLASVCWAAVQTVDKTLVTSEAPSSNHYLAVSGTAAIVPIAFMPILLQEHVTLPAAPEMIGGILAGVFYFASNACFFRALLTVDASVAAAVLATIPAVTAVGSWLILRQELGPLPILGICAITVGVVLMSQSRREGESRQGVPLSAWLFLAGAEVLLVAEYLLEGALVRDLGALDVFFWTRVGVALSTIALAIGNFRLVKEAVQWGFFRSRRIGALTIVNEGLDMAAVASLIAAYSAGPVGLATAVAYTQTAFVFVATVLINIMRPGTIPTEGDRLGRGSWWRIVGLVIVVGGVFAATA